MYSLVDIWTGSILETALAIQPKPHATSVFDAAAAVESFSRELREQSAPFPSANGNHHGCRHKLSKALSQMDGGVGQKTKTCKPEAVSLKKSWKQGSRKRLFKRNLLQIDYVPKISDGYPNL